MGFWTKFKEQFKEDMAKQKNQQNLNAKKKAEMSETGEPFCPKCFSKSVEPFKKGFGVGKAITGGVLLGPIGLLGGFIGKNKIQMHCLKCGNDYKSS